MADRRLIWLLAVAVGALGSGCTGEPKAVSAASDAGETSTTAAVTVPDAVRRFEAARDYRTLAPPVAVDVPALGIASALEELHRHPDGTIEVPSWHAAGWWADGPKPGQPGPAVILGHVDSRHGPDVFYRLGEVQPGQEIVVTRADGTTVHFSVDRVERVPKESFPTEMVFAPTLTAGLRLVTCGGAFDRAVGHYEDNVIVFATLTG
jgi:Sortase domain